MIFSTINPTRTAMRLTLGLCSMKPNSCHENVQKLLSSVCVSSKNFKFCFPFYSHQELGQRSQYCEWLQAGRLRGQISSPSRSNIFLLSISSTLVLGTIQPPIQWVPGALLPGVKQPACKADHSSSTCAKVKNGGSIHPLPHMPSWHRT
jgi:hypothetical protein